METIRNKKRREFDDNFETFVKFDEWARMVKKKEQEKEKNMLTIKHFLSMRLIMEKIDFKKLYDDYIQSLIEDKNEEYRTSDSLQEAKLHKCILKQNEPTTEFIIMIIIANILDLCEENQFELGMLNGQPHYFNNYYYVEINEILMKELLSDISRRSGVKNYEDRHFINEIYRSLTYKLIPFSYRHKSYKERGTKLTKLPKRMISQEDCYFKKRLLRNP